MTDVDFTPRNGSTYPPAVADLVPKAAELAQKLGTVPSRNQIMKEFKVGSPKATLVREALTAEPGSTPTPSVGAEGSDAPAASQPAEHASSEVTPVGHPGTNLVANTSARRWYQFVPVKPARKRRVPSWPVFLIALPAAVAIWSGWVGLGSMTGFGVVHPLPGIADGFSINTAITLPIGVEAYAAYALKAWLSGNRVPVVARRFAMWSAIASLIVGSLGQIAFHLMESRGITEAPWQITTIVASLPVIVLGMGAALAHLLHRDDDGDDE